MFRCVNVIHMAVNMDETIYGVGQYWPCLGDLDCGTIPWHRKKCVDKVVCHVRQHLLEVTK